MRIDPKGNPEDARESGEFKVHYHLNGGVHRLAIGPKASCLRCLRR